MSEWITKSCCFSSCYIHCNLLLQSCQTKHNGCHLKGKSITVYCPQLHPKHKYRWLVPHRPDRLYDRRKRHHSEVAVLITKHADICSTFRESRQKVQLTTLKDLGWVTEGGFCPCFLSGYRKPGWRYDWAACKTCKVNANSLLLGHGCQFRFSCIKVFTHECTQNSDAFKRNSISLMVNISSLIDDTHVTILLLGRLRSLLLIKLLSSFFAFGYFKVCIISAMSGQPSLKQQVYVAVVGCWVCVNVEFSKYESTKHCCLWTGATAIWLEI